MPLSLKEKIHIHRLADRSELGVAEYEQSLYRSLLGRHFLHLHSIVFLPEPILKATPPEIHEIMQHHPKAKMLEDLSFRNTMITYFEPGTPFFIDWVSPEGEATTQALITPETIQKMSKGTRDIIKGKLGQFLSYFAPYQDWITSLDIHVSREETLYPKPDTVRSVATIALVAEVEPTDVVKRASRRGLYQIVAEGKNKVKSYVNTPAVAKAKQYRAWLSEQARASETGPELL